MNNIHSRWSVQVQLVWENDLENVAAFIIISEKRSDWVHTTNTRWEELGEFS